MKDYIRVSLPYTDFYSAELKLLRSRQLQFGHLLKAWYSLGAYLEHVLAVLLKRRGSLKGEKYDKHG